MGDTLYHRLGGEQGLSAIVRDVIDLHLINPLVKVRFQDADRDRLHRLAFEFFGMGTGGPQKYSGKDMREVHRSMNISGDEYLAVVDDIMKALEKNKIGPDTRTEVLGILYSLKDEIVRV
jgi:hemoglobin